MRFRHASCPDYEVTANVYQDIIVTIPPFHYFVVKFTWSGSTDVDIAVEFAGNHLTNVVRIIVNMIKYLSDLVCKIIIPEKE